MIKVIHMLCQPKLYVPAVMPSDLQQNHPKRDAHWDTHLCSQLEGQSAE